MIIWQSQSEICFCLNFLKIRFSPFMVVSFQTAIRNYFCIQPYYHPHMQVGNVLSHVCVSVCVLSVQAITFEPLDIETSFFGMQVHLNHI